MVGVFQCLLARNLGIFDKDKVSVGWPFRELVGSLMRLSTRTRPDISNAVRAVARYCAAPTFVHWRISLGIVGYLSRTSSLGTALQRGTVTRLSMHVLADADNPSKAAGRRAVSGGLVMCGGVCVSWFSRTHRCVTFSTTEARVRGT